MLAGGDETTEVEIETTTIEITTLSENDNETTTTIDEDIDETTNSNEAIETTTESDSENFTTENLSDENLEKLTESEEISTEIPGTLLNIQGESSRILVKQEINPGIPGIQNKTVEEKPEISNENSSILETSTIENKLNPRIHKKMLEEVQENPETQPSTKIKVQKVLIFKRPIFKNSSTESMVTMSRAENSDNFFKSIESTFIDMTTKAIIFWKTSLLIVVVFILAASLSYYRRRIIRLKAEIVEKNLGNSYNQSCSHPSSANAYTPTYFPRRCATNNPKYPIIVDSDYESSVISRSNCYSQTYNSVSLHSYESIDDDDQSNEHIYAEIGVRKGSLASVGSNKKPSNFENSYDTNCKFSNFLPLSFINPSFNFHQTWIMIISITQSRFRRKLRITIKLH